MNEHRSDIRIGKTEKPVAAHITLPGHSLDDLEVMGIEKICKEFSLSLCLYVCSLCLYCLRKVMVTETLH